MADYVVAGESGRPVTMDDIPSVRLLRGEDPEPLLMRTVHRNDRRGAVALLKAAPCSTPTGRSKRPSRSSRTSPIRRAPSAQAVFLAQVSAAAGVVAGLRADAAQRRRLAVPRLADWCAVDLVDEDGDREPVAVAHADPAKLRWPSSCAPIEPAQLDPSTGSGGCCAPASRCCIREIPDEMLVAAARRRGAPRAAARRRLTLGADRADAVGSRTIGAMTLVSAESGRSFDAVRLEFAEQIAARRRWRSRTPGCTASARRSPTRCSRACCPTRCRRSPAGRSRALYRPGRRRSEVGGDFYDVWQLDDDWLLIIGDVTGKGVAGGGADLAGPSHHAGRLGVRRAARPRSWRGSTRR